MYNFTVDERSRMRFLNRFPGVNSSFIPLAFALRMLTPWFSIVPLARPRIA